LGPEQILEIDEWDELPPFLPFVLPWICARLHSRPFAVAAPWLPLPPNLVTIRWRRSA
jgi:hypothetical protein